MSFLNTGDQNCAQYSKCGRTSDLYRGNIGGLSTALQNAADKPLMPLSVGGVVVCACPRIFFSNNEVINFTLEFTNWKTLSADVELLLSTHAEHFTPQKHFGTARLFHRQMTLVGQVELYRQTLLFFGTQAAAIVIWQQLPPFPVYLSETIMASLPSLMHLCRLQIRSLLKTEHLRSNKFISQLPLPVCLQDYLQYSDVLHHYGVARKDDSPEDNLENIAQASD
ncbi:unnamed protein product [Ranitomeya imitator]|uniref:SOCS box domain-containing protein n=1 Tax=Ranitomeya imitator TaxID=111125 RepID=A0ABN9LUM2_9NEOB|nr:unnamed protein product [Ranitomeya imitator]